MLPEYMRSARFVIPAGKLTTEQFNNVSDALCRLDDAIRIEPHDSADGGVEFEIEVSVSRDTNLDEIQAELMEIMKASEVQHGG